MTACRQPTKPKQYAAGNPVGVVEQPPEIKGITHEQEIREINLFIFFHTSSCMYAIIQGHITDHSTYRLKNTKIPSHSGFT